MSERYLTRREASEYLKQKGLPVAPTTLAKYVTVGGGPIYQSFGRMARYRPSDLDAWVQERLSAPRRNSSEAA
ncbi:MAG: helix-turn-helix domain-containing protein [Pseudomonadota bacterium]